MLMSDPVTPNPEPSELPSFAWGKKETQFFYDLNPDGILDAVEEVGYRCTGRCLALNSMENRVYEIEWNDPSTDSGLSYLIAKFYRPGRWSDTQIKEEHQFLLDLKEQEIPAIAPLADPQGRTLHQMETNGIYYTLFPRQGGRNPDELQKEQLQRLGRLLARVHDVGDRKKALQRIILEPDTYGLSSLDYLLDKEILPEDLESNYADTVEEICERSQPLFSNTPVQRIHGDCHLGNVIWRMDEVYLVDFDDMVNGPCIQDLWLLAPGRDPDSKRQFSILLDSYQEMRAFDHTSLNLIEPLRALRYIHFSAWMAKRWDDPAFPQAFPHYGTRHYWLEQLQDLKDCLNLMTETSH